MRRLRARLFVVTTITLVLHTGAVTLGAVRACWGTQHLHAGIPVEDCAMHHRADGFPPGYHSHHVHGRTGAEPMDDGERVSCTCSNDSASPYVGPSGVVSPAMSLSEIALGEMVTPVGQESLTDVQFPPLSPPPRPTFSSRS